MPDKPVRVALYGRVSTADQTADNQLIDLRRYCLDRGWTVAEEFVDTGISGTKATRPALDKMMNRAKKRQIDVVLVWRFDRFARSVKHLVTTLEELRQLNVSFVSFQENIDTSSPLGSAIFTIIAAMAELERNIIVDRVRAGLRRAVAEGKQLGRPKSDADENEIKQLRQQGMSLRQIANKTGASKSTVSRLLTVRNPD
ncbi:MAG: recombinase family protein [Planctomycetota bacterium]